MDTGDVFVPFLLVVVPWFCFFFFDYARHGAFEKEREREREKGRNVAKNYKEVVERKYLLLRLKKMCLWMDVVI